MRAIACILPLSLMLGSTSLADSIPCYEIAAVVQAPPCPFPPSAGGIFAIGLNTQNVILGHVSSCPFDDATPFLWTMDNGFELIRWPPTAVMFEAFGLNDRGVVVGSMNIPGNGLDHVAFKYERGTITALGTVPGGNFSTAGAVNNLGHVVGAAGNTFDDPPDAALWIDDRIIDIGVDLPATYSYAVDISNLDLVVGYIGGNPLVYQRGFVWDKGSVTILDVVPGGISSQIDAVNNREQAVGHGVISQLPVFPFTTITGAFLWKAGQFTIIEAPGYIEVFPYDINDDGIVVGQIGDDGTTSEPNHGFVWRDGVLRDIHDLVDVAPNLNINSVTAVNEAGVLVANAKTTDTEIPMVLLLTPKPAQPADLSGDCHVDGKDLMILLRSWGPVGKRNANPAADLDDNGIVNGFDLGILLAAWG